MGMEKLKSALGTMANQLVGSLQKESFGMDFREFTLASVGGD